MRGATAVAVVLLTTGGFAAEERAHASIKHYNLNIPRQTLDGALKDLAQQTGLQIGRFSDSNTGSVIVGPITGFQSSEEVLQTLLAPQGLSYKIINDRLVAIINPHEQLSGISLPEASLNTSFATSLGRVTSEDSGTTEASPSVGEVRSARADQATVTEAGENRGALQEVVVTAQKREQSVKDVPVSISVLSGELLDKMAISDFSDVADSVPGLAFAKTGVGNSQYFIRGIGAVGAGQSPTTGVYLDEVPLQTRTVSNATQPDPEVFDVQRIEVLRGPQGVLFGSAAMGGTVRIITNPPDTKHFRSILESGASAISSGSQSYDAKGMVNVPFGNDKAALRVVAVTGFQGGWIDDLRPVTRDLTENLYNPDAVRRNANTGRYSMGRFSLLFTPSSTLEITPSFLYQRTVSDAGRNNSDVTFGLRARLQARYQPTFASDKFGISNLLVKKEIAAAGGLSLLSSSSYLDRDTDSNNDSSAFRTGQVEAIVGPSPNGQLYWSAVRDKSRTKQFTQEFRAVSASDSPLQYLFGVYYKTLDQVAGRTRPTLNLFGVPAPLPFGASNPPVLEQIDTTFKEREWALFGEVSYAFTHQWKLSLGGRYFKYNQNDHRQRYGAGGLPGGNLTYLFTQGNSENGVTPRAVLSYQPTKNVNVYASYSTGFRTGGVNAPITNDVCTPAERAAAGIPDVPPPYKSDKTDNLELGAKTSWLDGRLRVDASAFSIDWKDYQQSVQRECGTNPLFYTANAGKVTSRGGEMEFTMQATDHFDVNAGVAYTRAVYDRAFTTLGLPAGAAVLDVPRLTWSARANYALAVSQDWEGTLTVSANHVDGTISGFGEGAPLVRPPYTLTNVSFSLQRETLTLTVFADNVTDTVPVYAQEYATNPATTTATSNFAYVVGQPRTVGLRIRKVFQ